MAGLRGWEGWPPECFTYANNYPAGWPLYPRSNWNWPMWPEPQADAIAKIDQFYSLRNTFGNSEIIGMKYCYVDGWNQQDNVDRQYYINKMLQLEALYPNKIFIWATSALWADPGSACSGGAFNSCAGIAAFNQQIRSFALTHNKPLYDIADIESHSSNGSSCLVAGYEGMCPEWYDSGGGHPNLAGSIRLAKGFYYLIAKLAGTNPTVSPTPIFTTTPTPICPLGDLNNDCHVDLSDIRLLLSNYFTASTKSDLNRDSVINLMDFSVLLLNYGK